MRLLASAALLACTLSTAACRDTDGTAASTEVPADAVAGRSMPGMADRPDYTDARFLQQMTMHHRSAIDMAEMAQTRATDPAMKAMAAKMATDQQAEIAEMTGMLRALGETPDTTAAMAHEGMAGDHTMDDDTMDEDMMGMPLTMDELRLAQPFDRAFLVTMLGHHSTAITMSAEAQARSTSADVLRIARTIVLAQADEIKKMQAMLDAMKTAPAR